MDAQAKLVGIAEEPGALVLRLDTGEELTVAPNAVPPELLVVGGSLGSSHLHLLREASARKAAARALFGLLDRRLWTTTRLRRKLLDAGHEQAAVEAVIAQAEAQGLHSDRAFAEAFCRDALGAKAVGRMWLVSKLRAKGVRGEVATEVASAQLPAERERELARRAADVRWRRERGRDRLAEARVQRFLASRGFPAGLVRDTVRQAKPTEDETC